MTTVISKLALGSLFAIGAIAASAQASHRHCSAATIEGDYAIHISGEIFTPVGVIDRDGLALTHFDGDHVLDQVDYVLADGVLAPGRKDANGFNTDETGTYSVHENCTGHAEIDFPTPPGGTSGVVLRYFFIISDDGRQLSIIVSSITPPNSSTPLSANIHADGIRVHDRLSF